MCSFNLNLNLMSNRDIILNSMKAAKYLSIFLLFHQEREASIAGNLPFIWWRVFAHP